MENMTVQSGSLKAAAAVNSEMLQRFTAYLDTSKSTVETYKRELAQMMEYFATQGIKQPQREDILSFRDYLKESGKKPTTVQNYITAAKLFFRWTAQEGLYPNIADHVKGAKLDREHKKDCLTTAQVKAIMQGIDTSTLQGARDYAIFALMVTGGLRDIEVARANIEDLRAAGDTTVLYVQGKGREEKTAFVKVAPQTEAAIRAYLAKRGQAAEGEPLFVSTSNRSSGRLTTRSISRIIKGYMMAAGYNSDRLTAHSLRHTAVTLSLLAGHDITEVQQFARHSNINTTMIYAHNLDAAANGCSTAIAAAIF
jgi:integrase/recombinase XerD